jgi:tetratricopeptide (TPR) repeat protein
VLAVQRHAAQLDLVDAQLRLGQHVALVAGLSGQVVAYPLDERLAGQYMIALWRSGRPADAFRHYQQVRRCLADELGIEPGAALQRLHEQMLRSDPALSATSISPRVAPREVPRQLPMDVPGFAGRDQYLAELDLLLASTPGGPGSRERADARVTAAVVTAVSGTAGVGKTALAVHWAHRVAERFPDGQLYVNLRGYDLDPPVTAAEALHGFLHALGIAEQDVAAGVAERAAQFRSLLAGRRMLILLDNASGAEQVRPLLPGNPECVTLVTSRDSLAGLVARDGAVRLDLDLLPAGEAVELFRGLIGPRADTEAGPVAVLAEQCARLPLALRVAAELAIARPTASLADLAAELADEQRRLDLFQAGEDPRTAVRAVFSWSCRQLDSVSLRTFRLAGLTPGFDVDVYEVAALADITADHAAQVLDRLARVHLMHSVVPGRYGMHNLLRAYAREQVAAQYGESGRRKALARLLSYHLFTAASAMDASFSAEDDQRPFVVQPGTPVPSLTDPGRARDWLDANRASLIAVAGHAAAYGWPAHAGLLTEIIFRYLDHGGHYADAAALHAEACRAARQTGDRVTEANALIGLGVVDYHQGRYQEAADRIQQALLLSRAAGDRPSEARGLSNLGIVDFYQARYEQSVSHLQQGVAIYAELGYQFGMARVLGNLGTAEGRLGRHEAAIAHLDQALALHSEAGNRPGEAYALSSLGSTYRHLGSYQQAAEYQHRALTLFHAVGSRRSGARALTEIGDICRLQGDYRQASGYYQQALGVFRQIGDLTGEAEALSGLGEAFLTAGNPSESRAQHTAALAVASQIGDKFNLARAHEGIGHACYAGGDPVQGRHHWREAFALYTDIGAPEAARVRAQLEANVPDQRVG